MQHSLRKTFLQNGPVFFRRDDFYHSCTGPEYAFCTQNGCTGHAPASGKEQDSAKRPFVAVRCAARNQRQITGLHGKD